MLQPAVPGMRRMPGCSTGDVPRACRMMPAAHPVPGIAGVGRIRFMSRDRLFRVTGQRRTAPQRATLAILVLIYAAMRAATALRTFYFFQRIERLELEARRLAGLAGEGPGASSARRQIVSDVGVLRRAGEMNSYIDLLFLAMIVLLCISKIVTD